MTLPKTFRRSQQTSIGARSVTASHPQPVAPLQACPRRLPLRHPARRAQGRDAHQRRVPARPAGDADDADVTQLASQGNGSMDRHVRDGARTSGGPLADAIVEPVVHADGGGRPSCDDHHVSRHHRQAGPGLQSAGGAGRFGKDLGAAVLKRGRDQSHHSAELFLLAISVLKIENRT